jgi:hypothetical protein
MAGSWCIRRGAVVECKWTDSPTMDCPDVYLEASWLQEWEWVLEDCHKRSCWKNSIGVSVPRPCGSDVYVCSKSCWLCLTVVYLLLEWNKVPSWIEPPSVIDGFIVFMQELPLQHFIQYFNGHGDHVDGATWRLWTPANNGPIFHPLCDIWAWRIVTELHRQEKLLFRPLEVSDNPTSRVSW